MKPKYHFLLRKILDTAEEGDREANCTVKNYKIPYELLKRIELEIAQAEEKRRKQKRKRFVLNLT